jgi:GTP-binding protein EngB required for normal cell division
MPLAIPEAMNEEHEKLHEELRKATKIPGAVGKAAKEVARVLHSHFERENELALPVISITRALAEGKLSPDFHAALDLADKFKLEYERMLQEHVEIVKALDQLDKVAKKAKKKSVVEFARKLKLHAKTEEDLTYPAVLMAGKLLQQQTATSA